MKIIIAGGRDFTDYALLKQKCDTILCNQTNIEIVSGRCDRGVHTFTTVDDIRVFGADGLGERYASEKGYIVHAFPADWNKYGNGAGPRRNEQMAKFSEALIAFTSGGNGTENMISKAKKHGLNVRVINC
jgi:hypothetical protein